jgi:hypothetical protein
MFINPTTTLLPNRTPANAGVLLDSPLTYWLCHTARAASVLDAVKGVIRGYIFIWGDADHRDSYGTYFAKDRPPKLDIDSGMHVRPLKYEHAFDKQIRRETIGVITRYGFDDIGCYFDAELDKSSPFFARTLSEIDAQELKTSSATMNHTGGFYDDGAFMDWTVGEVSLTKNPSESRMPAVVLIRSGVPQDDTEGERDAARVETPTTNDLATDGAASPTLLPDLVPQEEQATMNLQEQIAAILADTTLDEAGKAAAIAALLAPQPEAAPVAAEAAPVMMSANAPVAPVAAAPAPRSAAQHDPVLAALNQIVAQNAQFNTRMAAIEQEQRKAENEPAPKPNTRTGGNGGVGANVNLIPDRKFANMSNMQLFAAVEIARQTERTDLITDNLRSTVAHRALDYLRSEGKEKPDLVHYRSAYTRVDDFMASNIAGQGLEAVGIFYGTEVWQKTRIEPMTDQVLKRGMWDMEVPDGANSIYVTLEGNDAEFFTTAQANDLDATGSPEIVVNTTFHGTDRVLVTPGELTGAVAYTDILEEDALYNISAEIDRKLNKKAPEVVEGLMFNGDTATAATTNINAIDGTPATGINMPYYLASDGFLKLALVTNTAMSRDASGGHDESDYRETINLLPDELIANPDGLMFIEDVKSYQRALDISATKTADVSGGYANASIFTGKVLPFFGVEVFRTGRMALANTAGKISVTAGNNTKGRLLCVYPEEWAMVWKRRIVFERVRLGLSKTTVVIASLRIAFRRRSNTSAALTYNFGIS